MQKTNQIEISIKNFIEVKEESICIPDYQRPYAWEEKQVETLLNDLKDVIESEKKSYLLGSLIFHQNTDSCTLDIVDGQQRLVTLALINHCLSNANTKVGCHCEECCDFLMTQKFLHSESQKNLKNNFDYIKKWFVRNEDEREKFEKLLLGEESNEIEFVCIVTPNLDDAFIFFDSANSRGKKLEDYDLIKAYHLREIVEKSKKVRFPTMPSFLKKWQKIVNI